jgi:hypothetical protein
MLCPKQDVRRLSLASYIPLLVFGLFKVKLQETGPFKVKLRETNSDGVSISFLYSNDSSLSVGLLYSFSFYMKHM